MSPTEQKRGCAACEHNQRTVWKDNLRRRDERNLSILRDEQILAALSMQHPATEQLLPENEKCNGCTSGSCGRPAYAGHYVVYRAVLSWLVHPVCSVSVARDEQHIWFNTSFAVLRMA